MNTQQQFREQKTLETNNLYNLPEVQDALTKIGTPLMVFQPEILKKTYLNLVEAMPYAHFHYAVKAGSSNPVIETLKSVDGYFDVASDGEIQLLQKHGIDFSKVIHTHPHKKETHIVWAYEQGIRVFIIDSLKELHKFSRLKLDNVDILIRLSYQKKKLKVI